MWQRSKLGHHPVAALSSRTHSPNLTAQGLICKMSVRRPLERHAYFHSGRFNQGRKHNFYSCSSLSVMQATLLISVQNMFLRVDSLTASQRFDGSMLSKYQIIYFIQNGAYHDCDFNYNNGINTCGSMDGATFFVFSITLSECFIKSHSLNQPLSQKVLCTFLGCSRWRSCHEEFTAPTWQHSEYAEWLQDIHWRDLLVSIQVGFNRHKNLLLV